MARSGGPTFPVVAVLRGWALALFRPGTATIQGLVTEASWAGVAWSVGLAGLGAGLLRLADSGGSGVAPVGALVGGLALVLIAYSTLTVLLLFMADRFTRYGDTVEHAYAVALIWPPLLILLGLPLGGDLLLAAEVVIGALLFLYGSYLTYGAMQAVHGLNGAAARLVAAIPLLILAVIGALAWFVLYLLTTPYILTVPEPTAIPTIIP